MSDIAEVQAAVHANAVAKRFWAGYPETTYEDPDTGESVHAYVLSVDQVLSKFTMSQDAYDAAIAGARREGWTAGIGASLREYRSGTWIDYLAMCGAVEALQPPDAWPTPPNPLTKAASALGCDADEAACLDAIDSLRRELECSEDASSMERQRRKDAELTRDAAVDLASNRGEQVSRLTAELAKALDEAWSAADEERDEELALYSEIASAVGVDANAPIDTKTIVARVRELNAKEASGLPISRDDVAFWLNHDEEDCTEEESERVEMRFYAPLRSYAKHGASAPSRVFPEALREQITAWDELRSGCRSAHDLIRDVHAWLTSQPVDETESLRAELAASREHANLLASSLLMIASEAAGDPKIDHRDYRDPRYTPALRHVGELRREAESLRARVDELTRLEKERDEAMADMMLAREDLAGCEYDLAKLIRAVYDGRGFEDAANDAEMNGRDGWLDVALDIAAPGPARRMRSERDSARAKAIEEAARAVLAAPSKGVIYTPNPWINGLPFVDKADVVEAIRALADRGAK